MKNGLPTKLKAWRERRKLTRAAAAEQLGIPYSTFVKWERSERSPRGLALNALLERIKL